MIIVEWASFQSRHAPLGPIFVLSMHSMQILHTGVVKTRTASANLGLRAPMAQRARMVDSVHPVLLALTNLTPGVRFATCALPTRIPWGKVQAAVFAAATLATLAMRP